MFLCVLVIVLAVVLVIVYSCLPSSDVDLGGVVVFVVVDDDVVDVDAISADVSIADGPC